MTRLINDSWSPGDAMMNRINAASGEYHDKYLRDLQGMGIASYMESIGIDESIPALAATASFKIGAMIAADWAGRDLDDIMSMTPTIPLAFLALSHVADRIEGSPDTILYDDIILAIQGKRLKSFDARPIRIPVIQGSRWMAREIASTVRDGQDGETGIIMIESIVGRPVEALRATI